MSSEGSRLYLLCISLLGLLVGCAGVPPAPKTASQQQDTTSNSEYDGWLWKSLSGKKNDTAASSVQATANGSASAVPQSENGSQVQPTNYVATDPSSPLIPGPASTSRAASTPTPLAGAVGSGGASSAGPPPAIPSELPPPPAGAVSIKDMEAKKAEKSGFEWADLAPENIYKNLKAAAGYGPDEKIARGAMKDGQELFRRAAAMSNDGISKEAQGLFQQAGKKFAEAADRWPDTPLEEDALFLQAESEFFSDQYPKAHDTYGGLLKKYVNTRHLDTVVRREFAIGIYWEQIQNSKPLWTLQPNLTDNTRPHFDTFGYALQAYEKVRLSDPSGPLADHATMATGNAYFRHGQYQDAAYHYDLLRKDYPNSPHQMKAHLLDLQAKMRIYQGTDYDGTPLKEAGQIADQTLKQFGSKLGEEQQHVATARIQILEEQANRDFALARYYEQHAYYGAARMYYKSVIDKFPNTNMAKDARVAYDKIRSLPDEPPRRFAWLTNLFEPEDK